MVGLIYVILLMFTNYEFIHYEEKKSESDESLEENEIRRIEIASGYDRKKKKKFKTYEIQVVKEEKFSFWNLIYIHCDLYVNYCVICLLFFMIREIEKNYLIIVFYSFILLIFKIRVCKN
jgi:hypothetical protein